MKQIRHIYLIILCALAWSTGAWAAEWSQNYSYGPSGGDFNHVSNNKVSLTHSDTGASFSIEGNSLSYSGTMSGLELKKNVEYTLRWNAPSGYLITITSITARGGSDFTGTLNLTAGTASNSVYVGWKTGNVTCNNLSLGSSSTSTLKATGYRVFLYGLTISYTLKLDYTVLNTAITNAETAKGNLSYSTLKNYIQSAITTAKNSKTDGSLTSPSDVIAKANWLNAITNIVGKLNTAWGVDKAKIPDAIYDLLHQYDGFDPNDFETAVLNSAASDLQSAIDKANATTSTYQTAKNTTLPSLQTQSNNNNPSGVADDDIRNAYAALERAETTTAISAAVSLVKQFDAITFNNVSQIKVNGTASGVATAHNTVSYSSDSPSIISVSADGKTLTAKALGSAIITAYTSTGNGYYAVAATKPFTVIRNENTLAVLGNQELKVEGTKSGVYSNKNSDAEVKYSITDVVYTKESQNNGTGVISYDVSTNTITALNAGSATLTIYQEANAVHEAVQKSLTVTVTKYDQTLSWNTLDFTILPTEMREADIAVANSGLAVTYSSSDESVISVDTGTGRLVGQSEGTAIITGSQPGNYKYNAAPSITHTFSVSKKQATFTPIWGEGASTDIKVGAKTSIGLTNIATDETFTITANPTGVISWEREGNTLFITGVSGGDGDFAETKLTLSQDEGPTVNGTKATYTIIVSKDANDFAVAAESKAMKVGEEWKNVVTNTGNNNTVVSYSTEGIATYDAAHNKITAVSEGSTTITFTQAATATIASATKTINVSVTKVANTLAISLPTQATEVGGTIALSITGQNNADAIVGTVNDHQLSSSVNNGTDVITYADGVITARNAGTAKITFSQPATTKYTAYTSETYEITVSKIHNTITITNLNGGTATNTTMKYNQTASLTYTSTNTDTSPVVTRSSGSYTTYSAGTITSGNSAGTDIYEISQAETYKYEAGYTSFTVRVNNTDEGVGYVLYEEKEYSHGTGAGVAHTYSWSGPGETLYYKACRGTLVTIYYNLYVEWSADNENWTECQNNTNLDPDYRDEFFSCPIPENARYVRFRFPGGGTLVKYIKDVRVTRKTYLEVTPAGENNFGNTYTDETKTATYTVNYSSVNGGNISISSDNPHFVPSVSSISVPTNKTATDTSTGNNTTYICGVDGTQAFTVTYTPDPDKLGGESAVITINDLFNTKKITLKATAQKYPTTIARGTNTATATTVDGAIDNAFAFSGTSTATPSASSDADFYYAISHTQTSAVNKGEGVISYDPATNTITGLNAGTARLTIYQKKTLKYNATSQTFDFTVSKLENNTQMSLSTKTLDVDDTATVGLTNADSDGALSAAYSSVEFTNEAQNRAGGLLSFAGNTLTAVNAGTATVTITQAETYKYVAKSHTFDVTVNKLTQTLTWDNPDLETTMQMGSTLAGNTATSSVGLTPVTYASGNTAAITVDANTGVLTAAATGSNIVITATQAGNYKYLPATLTRQFSVFNKKTPAFTPDAHFTGTNGRVEYTCTATITVTGVGADSEEGFTITNVDNSIIGVVRDGETITITGLAIGNTTLTLAQAGNEDYIAKSQTYNIEVYMPDDFLTLAPATTPSHNEGQYRKVFLNRTLKEGLSTIALPFNTTVAELTGRSDANDWVAQLETVTNSQADGYTLYFQKVDGGSITANQPYVLHLGSQVVNPTWTDLTDGITVAAASAGEKAATNGYSGYDGWVMHANYDVDFSMSGKYGIVNSAGGLMLGESGSTLAAYTAYIAPPAQVNNAPRLRVAYVDTDGTTTVVDDLPFDNDADAQHIAIYGPDGKRRSRLQPGVNIVRQADGTVRKVQR